MGRLSVRECAVLGTWPCCKHNDNIVSAHWEKTMLPDSLFLIRVWNNRWEIRGPVIIIYWPSFLGIDWAEGVLCVWRNSKLKFRLLPFFFLECSSCYKAGVTEIKSRKWKSRELYTLVNSNKFPFKMIPISKCLIKADAGMWGHEEIVSTIVPVKERHRQAPSLNGGRVN